MFTLTNTLPEESYSNWLTLAAYSRFIVKFRVAEPLAMTVLAKALREVCPTVNEFTEDFFATDFTKPQLPPIPPEFLLLMLAVDVKTIRADEHLTQDDWGKAIMHWARLGAVAYAKAPVEVGRDMIKAFTDLEDEFLACRFEKSPDTLFSGVLH